MASFIVVGKDGVEPDENIRFVRDGFVLFAFALPVIWLIWQRLWLHVALYFAAAGLGAGLIAWSGSPVWTGFSVVATACFSLLVALEGGHWVRQSLENNGYRVLGVIEARNEGQAVDVFASQMNDENLQKSPKNNELTPPINAFSLEGVL